MQKKKKKRRIPYRNPSPIVMVQVYNVGNLKFKSMIGTSFLFYYYLFIFYIFINFFLLFNPVFLEYFLLPFPFFHSFFSSFPLPIVFLWFLLILLILTMQTNSTKTNKPSEFQTVGNLPFNNASKTILPFLKINGDCECSLMS